MSNNDCSCRPSCGTIAVIASIIIGVITAILRFTAVITLTPAFLWVVLGIAVAYQAVLVITTSASCKSGCICSILPFLQTGILGAILTSVILLAITFAATSVLGAIIAGVTLAFLSLIFTATACLIKCFAGYDD